MPPAGCCAPSARPRASAASPSSPTGPTCCRKYRVRMEGDAARFPVLLSNGNRVAHGEGGERPPLGRVGGPVPQALLSVRAGRRRPRGQPRQLHHHERPQGRSRHLGARSRPAQDRSTRWTASSWRWRGTRRSTAANMTSTSSTSSPSATSTWARWRTRASTSSTRPMCSPTRTPRPTPTSTISRGSSAHEYFHNWSGDRVTCRDWFQLSLKEGFTVFRDQSFSADIGSPAVKRIEDVRVLRAVQFPEDAGPARPPGPARQLYRDFATSTRRPSTTRAPSSSACSHTVLGPDKFRAGTDLYFERHDGEAATCDDFVKALEDAQRRRPVAVQDLVQPGRHAEGQGAARA